MFASGPRVEAHLTVSAAKDFIVNANANVAHNWLAQLAVCLCDCPLLAQACEESLWSPGFLRRELHLAPCPAAHLLSTKTLVAGGCGNHHAWVNQAGEL